MPRLPLHKVLSWVTADKEKNGDPQAATGEAVHFRRSSRIPRSIPITLSGQDELGKDFEDKALTHDVNKHGAKIVTSRPLAPGAPVTLSNPSAGRTCLAKVIWRARFSENGFETGIEVAEPQDPELIWAAESTPSDWVEGCLPPTADQRLEFLCQRARSDRSVVESSGQSETASSTSATVDATHLKMTAGDDSRSHTAPAPSAEPTDPAEATDPLSLSTEKVKSELKPARQTPRSKAKLTLLALNLGHSSGGAAKPSITGSEESVRKTEEPPATGSSRESLSPERPEVLVGGRDDAVGNNGLEPSLHVVEEPPAAESSGPADQIGDTLREVQQKVSEESSAASGVTLPSAENPGSPSTAAVEKLIGELRSSGEEVVNQVREQLAHMTYKSLEILTQKAKATTDGCRDQLTKVLEQTISRSKDSVSSTIRRATEQAVTELQSGQQKLEAGFETRALEYEKRFEELSASAAEGLERQSDAMVASFQGRLDNALVDFEQKAGQRLQELTDRITTQFEKNWVEQAEKQVTAMADRLGEKLRIAGSAVVDEAKNELASVTKASLEAVTQATAVECHSQLDRIFREQSETVSGAAEAAVDSIRLAAEQSQAQLRIVRQEMGGSFETSAHESEKRLAAQIARGMEAIERKSNVIVEGFEIRLGSTLNNVEERAGKELSAVLDKLGAKKREESVREFEAHAAEAERKLKAGLTASGESVVEEARRLAGITQSALESLSQTAAEECRKKIDEFRSQTVAAQRQMEEISKKSPEVRRSQVAAAGKPRPSRGAGFVVLLVFLLGLIPAGAAVYLSTRPVMRLRPEPPVGFVDSNPKWNAKRAAAEDQVARAYWDTAVQNVQPMYHYGSSLPADPPVAFQVDPETLAVSGVKMDLGASRERYWQKLREAWGQPQTWEQSYGWNTDWINNLSSRIDASTTKPNRGKSATPQEPGDANP